jgi:hypothetical protein
MHKRFLAERPPDMVTPLNDEVILFTQRHFKAFDREASRQEPLAWMRLRWCFDSAGTPERTSLALPIELTMRRV